MDSPTLLGVESVFNGKNYWVNMQEAPSVAVCPPEREKRERERERMGVREEEREREEE
jgi:hypothetical protein